MASVVIEVYMYLITEDNKYNSIQFIHTGQSVHLHVCVRVHRSTKREPPWSENDEM